MSLNFEPITYVLCAAGLGTRTKEIGKSPKPFLKVKGKTLLDWSLESLPLQTHDQLILVFLKEHRAWVEKHKFLIKNKIEILYLDEVTSGQAETAYKAALLFKNKKLVIFNSDTYFKCPELTTYMADENIDGLIPCTLQNQGNYWSFCKVQESSGPLYTITSVTEKIRISNYCSVGFYYFKNSFDFIKNVNANLKNKSLTDTKELYVAPIYNFLLEENKNLQANLVKEFKAIGSLEQIEYFWNIKLSELQAENNF